MWHVHKNNFFCRNTLFYTHVNEHKNIWNHFLNLYSWSLKDEAKRIGRFKKSYEENLCALAAKSTHYLIKVLVQYGYVWGCICVLLAGHGYFVQTGRRLAGGRQQTCGPMHTYTHTTQCTLYRRSHTVLCVWRRDTIQSLVPSLALKCLFKIDLPKRQTRLYTAKNISSRPDGQDTTLLHGAEFFLES